MLCIDHRRYGSKQAHLAPTPVPELANLFRRSPGSILAKMANLDGGLVNSGRGELEAAAMLLSCGAAGLLHSYSTIVEAARSEGISSTALPDFLGHNGVDFAGQEELTDADIEDAITTRVRDLSASSGLRPKVTEKLLIAVARVGQHRFANDVLSNCGHQCVFCGLSPGPELAGKGLLRASHIKPWRDSKPHERLDTGNGISACPDHDAAFDTGLFHLTDNLEVRPSGALKQRMVSDERVRQVFGQPPVADVLILPLGAQRPRPAYVRWHRDRVATG